MNERLQIVFALQARSILLDFEKVIAAYLFQMVFRNHAVGAYNFNSTLVRF